MSTTPPNLDPAPSPSTRCVILSEAGAKRLEVLIHGLQRRRLPVLLVDDAPRVMVALAEHQTQTLIVDDPDRHGSLVQLLEAVRQYYPRTFCWKYEAAGPGLTPLQTKGQPAEAAPQPEPVHTIGTALSSDELDMLLGPAQDADQ
jgi:hypothetical protein